MSNIRGYLAYGLLAAPFIGALFFEDREDAMTKIASIIMGISTVAFVIRVIVQIAKGIIETFNENGRREIFKSERNRRMALYGLLYVGILFFIFKPVIEWIDSATANRGYRWIGFSENVLGFLFRFINLALILGIYKFFEEKDKKEEKSTYHNLEKRKYFEKKVYFVEAIGKAIELSKQGKYKDSNKIYNNLLKDKDGNILHEYIEDIIVNKGWNFVDLGEVGRAKKYFNLALKTNPENELANKGLENIRSHK